MGFLRYYGRVLRVAFTHSINIAQAVIFALVILFGLATRLLPKSITLTSWASALAGWQIAAEVLGGIVIIRLVLGGYWVFDAEKKRSDGAEQKIKGSLKFERAIRKEGDGGHYTAYATVRNTSLAAKMDCRCEIVELRDVTGGILRRNITLRSREQQPTQGSRGQFQLDQNAENDIPLFEIDQLDQAGFTLYVIGAFEKIGLEYGVYTARICAYGDRGKPDKITVQVNTRSIPNFVETIASPDD